MIPFEKNRALALRKHGVRAFESYSNGHRSILISDQ